MFFLFFIASLRARRHCLVCRVQRRHWRFYFLTKAVSDGGNPQHHLRPIRDLLFRLKELPTLLKQTQSWLWDDWMESQGIRSSVLALPFASLEQPCSLVEPQFSSYVKWEG